MTQLTAEDTAYESLKTLIVKGKLPEGEFLKQRDLAGTLDTAVVTLRCALRRLENEGLIESVPKWGVRIPMETRQSITDRYFIREVLEIAAIQRILESKDPVVRAKLEAAAAACDRVAEEDPENVAIFSERHLSFHTLIAENSDSPLLVKLLKQINTKSQMLSNARRGWGSGMDRQPHGKLVQDLFTLPMHEAEEAMREHIRRGLAWELQAIGDEG
jgi:DNA-binding GntR family transcriptional regulator